MAGGSVKAAEPRDPIERLELPEVHGEKYSALGDARSLSTTAA